MLFAFCVVSCFCAHVNFFVSALLRQKVFVKGWAISSGFVATFSLKRSLSIVVQEKRIYDLKKKNQELEKFKFVLDYKIKELKKQIEPREKDIKQMREQIAEVCSALRSVHK